MIETDHIKSQETLGYIAETEPLSEEQNYKFGQILPLLDQMAVRGKSYSKPIPADFPYFPGEHVTIAPDHETMETKGKGDEARWDISIGNRSPIKLVVDTFRDENSGITYRFKSALEDESNSPTVDEVDDIIRFLHILRMNNPGAEQEGYYLRAPSRRIAGLGKTAVADSK